MQNIRPLGGHQLLLLLVQFGLLLAVARALGEAARRLRLPSVVGELLAGLALGPSLLGALAPGLERTLFPPKPEQVHLIEVLSWIGVLMLLILTGLETDVGLILRKGKGALAISAGGVAVPFAAGIALASALPHDFVARADQRGVFVLFVGTAMSISAIPVIAKVLMDMDIIRRDIAQITLAAGMIDDTVGWILLSVVSGLAIKGVVNLVTAGQSIVAVLAVFLLSLTIGRSLVARVIRWVDNRVGGEMAKISTLMVIALAFASLTQLLGLEAVLGAFIAGILVGQVKRFDHKVRQTFRDVALGVFAPVFFAVSGLRVNLAQLLHPKVLAVGLAVLAVAIVGKFAGAYGGARLARLSHWEGLSLGAGMNARGAMEIIVATIGLSLGILTSQMYSIILLTAIVTSLMAPPLLRWTLQKVEIGEEEKLRLEAEHLRRESFVANLKRVLVPATPDGTSNVAAHLLRLMLRDEDVEVTTLHLQQSAENGRAEVGARPLPAEPPGDGQQPHNVRTLVRAANGQPWQAVLTEAERGYDLLVLGTEAPGGPGRASQATGGPSSHTWHQRLRRRRHGPGQGPDRSDNNGGDGEVAPKDAPRPPASGERPPGDGTVESPPEETSPEGPLFSQFVDELIQKSPCPVLIVSAPPTNGDAGTPARVLLPVWGHHGVSRGAEIAFAIARDQNIVVKVLHPVAGQRRRLAPGMSSAVRNAVHIGRDLVGKVAEFGNWLGASVETEVAVSDNPEQAVVENATRHAGLIVLETTRAPVTQRAFFGHDVDYLLRHAPCPVALITVPEPGGPGGSASPRRPEQGSGADPHGNSGGPAAH